MIHLTQEEGCQLQAAARQVGLAPAAFVRKLMTAHLVPAHNANAASIALLQSWLAEDATTNMDELRQAQEELGRFKRAINAERLRGGARLL